jgi:hypothetical protein
MRFRIDWGTVARETLFGGRDTQEPATFTFPRHRNRYFAGVIFQ